MNEVIFCIVTVSDTCFQDESKDRSGPRLVNLIHTSFSNAQIRTCIVPDECERIMSVLRSFIRQDHPNISCVITTGGTGFGERDVTPEATRAVIQKECPQLAMYMAQASLEKTKFAALTRGVCGIAGKTLIMNFPGSEKAVIECYQAINEILPHALHLIGNEFSLVRHTHDLLQCGIRVTGDTDDVPMHSCPHRTGRGDDSDRNSPYLMLPVQNALQIIFQTVRVQREYAELLAEISSPLDIPPFRASIKDGYAMSANGFSGVKKVVGYISAGDGVNPQALQDDECFKINTGAPMPTFADCVVQIEDTKLLKTKKDGTEDLVEILIEPTADLDIRPIGSDLRSGSKLFPTVDHSQVVVNSVMASVGQSLINLRRPKVAIISTGSELIAPNIPQQNDKIYDSNTTMLHELLKYFGFDCQQKVVINDELENVKMNIVELFKVVDFIICSGGVSMGDKDYIKPALRQLGFHINFGRVNMKPGKPMTFASCNEKYFFGLPGNPVSAFVTFHLFVLPAIRWNAGWQREKCELATVTVTLQNESINLDPRPEYARASVTSKNGRLYATINGSQMSSRLQSIVGADVLVQLPQRSLGKTVVLGGDTLTAYVLRYDFISKYE